MRARGEGSIYQRPDSRVWWVKYSRNGKPFRQATEFLIDCGNAKQNATARRNAENFLKQKLAEIKTGTFVPPSAQRSTVSDLADDFLRDYRINNRKSLDHAEFRWQKHLEPFFGHLRASDVTSNDIARYVDERQKSGASNATINRELAALKRMFRIGLGGTPPKVQRVPVFPRLKESAPRKGFLTDTQRTALAKECGKVGLWMRTFFEIASTYGWRSSEVKGLRVRHVDIGPEKGTIRLDTSKNGQPRTVTFKPKSAVGQLLSACIAGKKPDDPLFTRERKHEEKDFRKLEVKDFRKTWQNVCVAAGVGQFVCVLHGTETCECSEESKRTKYTGLIPHDLRRTAARDLRRAGAPESVIMSIGGWLTAQVFRRYAIVAENDISDALDKLEADRRERARESRYGHVSATSENRQQQSSFTN